MTYAAKRIWPDRPKNWEHQGEAESVEAFALAFAEERGLGLGTQIMVLDKDSEDAAVELLQVTATDPYALAPAAPGRESGVPSADASVHREASNAESSETQAAFPGSAFSLLFFLVRTTVLVALGVFAFGYVLRLIIPHHTS